MSVMVWRSEMRQMPPGFVRLQREFVALNLRERVESLRWLAHSERSICYGVGLVLIPSLSFFWNEPLELSGY